MREIEIQLYTIDENTSTSRHLAHQTRTKKEQHTSNRKYSQQKLKSVQHPRNDLSKVRCYKCNNIDHYANKCP